MVDMTTLIGAAEASRTLGVTKPTLYAYVSRGLLSRRAAIDGRTSLYDRTEIETLAARSRRRTPVERPSIDVQIATAITHLDDDSPSYRGRRVLDLVGSCRFEEVADLLLVGDLAGDRSAWRVDRAALEHARRVVAAAAPTDPITALALSSLSLGDRPEGDAAAVARALITMAPSVLGGPLGGDVASRLARAWVRRPTDELTAAISCALVLLADHELATSTLAVRVAASVRTTPAAAIATGLNVVAGPYHGAASSAAAAMFDEAAETGATQTVEDRLRRGERLPGFGHTVYRTGDPRFAPLLAAVRSIPAAGDRIERVDAVIAEAGRSVGALPNVDLALGALYHVADLPRDVPVFAVARIAGWGAHYAEESNERAVRFRGLAAPR